MKSKEIRQSFLDYFAERGHRVYPSAPLVPHGDQTLLFTNAGMVQFKEFFLGLDKPESPRAATAQKCLRVSGKHNDLENVGPSPRHHTFFEMLGNFSFGDYFKAEAIELGWDLVTGVWGLSKERLFATVFEEDDEAYDLWLQISDLTPERVRRRGKADNFWSMGDTGPCGPCSEIFVDIAPELPGVPFAEGDRSGRYLEIWNLVFMQFERGSDGLLTPLPNPSIDTGAGLERLAAVFQGVASNYDTDLFEPILGAAAELAGLSYGGAAGRDVSLRVIADHLRAVTFLLSDGVIPGNEGRGYVLRRILRRAVRHGMRLGFEEPFLHRLIPVLGEVMGEAYPELAGTREASSASVRTEEEKFLNTVATGARQVQEEIEKARGRGAARLPGEAVFRLYDTFGLPLEVIGEIAEEEGMVLDETGFEKALEEQREQSRRGAAEGKKSLAAIEARIREAGALEATEFSGYESLEETEARVQRVIAFSEKGPVVQRPVRQGEEGVLVADKTPFYAESGGQVGDRGEITWDGGRAAVTDTQKSRGAIYHFIKVDQGTLDAGAGTVRLRVDSDHRLPTQLNHTATHVLHAALRQVLGEEVRQAGSLVEPERLRFDFTFSRPVTEEERQEVEEIANRWIRRAEAVGIVSDRDYQDAVGAGAMALFGEKYPPKVRTVEIPGFSLELCGGCHVANTGEIGLMVIIGERGIASGVRRIEALTGAGALAWARGRDRVLGEVESALGVPGERVASEVDELRRALKEKDRELAKLRLRMVSGAAGGEDGRPEEIEGIKLLVREVPWAPAGELRNMADSLRSKLGSGVVFLASREEGKVRLVAAVTADLKGRLHAGDLVKKIAPLVGGGGGGGPDFAQAGGRDPEKLPEALKAVAETLREQLETP